MKFIITSTVVFAVFAWGATPSLAVPTALSDAYTTTTAGVTTTTFGTYTNTTCPGGRGTGCSQTYTSSYDGNGDLSISANDVGGSYAGGNLDFTGDEDAGFFFEVNGPSTSTLIPLLLTANASTSVGTSVGTSVQAAMTAYVAIFENANFQLGSYDPTAGFPVQPTLFLVAASCSGVGVADYCSDYGNPASSFSGTYSLSVKANQIDQLQEALRGQVLGTFASGTIDPMLVIDPTWLASNPGYSLSFSTNAGGVTVGGVPEPFTLSLFGAGLAGAVAMRRRKAKA